MEEDELVVTVMVEFEDPHSLNLFQFLHIHVVSILAQRKKPALFPSKCWPESRFFRWRLDGKNGIGCCRQNCVPKFKRIKTSNNYQNFHSQHFHNKQKQLLNQALVIEQKTSDWDRQRRNRTCSSGREWNACRCESVKREILRTIGLILFWFKDQKKWFLTLCFSDSVKVFRERLVEEILPVVREAR